MFFRKFNLIFNLGILTLVNISVTSVKAQNVASCFSDWCNEKESLSPETEQTIEAIIKSFKVTSCEEVAEKVPKVFSLRIINQDISDLRSLTSFVNLNDLTSCFIGNR